MFFKIVVLKQYIIIYMFMNALIKYKLNYINNLFSILKILYKQKQYLIMQADQWYFFYLVQTEPSKVWKNEHKLLNKCY